MRDVRKLSKINLGNEMWETGFLQQSDGMLRSPGMEGVGCAEDLGLPGSSELGEEESVG